MSVLALALPREVIEIEVPDNSPLDAMSSGSTTDLAAKFSPKRRCVEGGREKGGRDGEGEGNGGRGEEKGGRDGEGEGRGRGREGGIGKERR
jgi:hypothetical protein